MDTDIDRVLIPADRIQRRVAALARQIAETYRPCAEQGVVLIAVLSGAVVFLADLIRMLPFKMKIGLIAVSRYRGPRTEPGDTLIIAPLRAQVTGRHVLIVDDILDSGHTIRRVRDEVSTHHPASVRVCVLLRKPAKAPADLEADFVGFDIDDDFVVGYGLDYDDHYRNYPAIATLRPQLYG